MGRFALRAAPGRSLRAEGRATLRPGLVRPGPDAAGPDQPPQKCPRIGEPARRGATDSGVFRRRWRPLPGTGPRHWDDRGGDEEGTPAVLYLETGGLRA